MLISAPARPPKAPSQSGPSSSHASGLAAAISGAVSNLKPRRRQVRSHYRICAIHGRIMSRFPYAVAIRQGSLYRCNGPLGLRLLAGDGRAAPPAAGRGADAAAAAGSRRCAGYAHCSTASSMLFMQLAVCTDGTLPGCIECPSIRVAWQEICSPWVCSACFGELQSFDVIRGYWTTDT